MPRFDKSRSRDFSNCGTVGEGTRPTKRTGDRVALRGTVVLSCSAFLLLGLPFLAFGAKAGAPSATRMEQRHWADFVETNFPFFSSVLDARQMGKDWPNENLTPRGLILNLGHDCWACFDTEL